MDFFRGQTVLITGASGGIGAAMARLLAPHGARLVLVARSEDALARLAAELRLAGAETTYYAHDLERPGAAHALFEQTESDGLTVDVLVNNAGYGVQGAFLEASAEKAEGQIGLNVTALTLLARYYASGMAERGRGGVLNVSSVAGYVPAPYFAVYAATKAYVRSFTDALHAELAPLGVNVTCLAPGPTQTGFGDRAGMKGAFFARGQTATEVAKAGLDALARNERVVVTGAANKVQAVAVGLLPRGFTLRVASGLMRRAGK